MTSQHSDSTIPGQRLSFDEPQHLCDAGIGVGLHKSDNSHRPETGEQCYHKLS